MTNPTLSKADCRNMDFLRQRGWTVKAFLNGSEWRFYVTKPETKQ